MLPLQLRDLREKRVQSDFSKMFSNKLDLVKFKFQIVISSLKYKWCTISFYLLLLLLHIHFARSEWPATAYWRNILSGREE